MAMPTAIPELPLTSKLGSFPGKKNGSSRLPSKFGTKSTVSFSISERSSWAIKAIFTSVYLMAAAESPSTDPKFPCPNNKGYRKLKSWTNLTRESYTAASPWGWYFPKTSPTTRADFLVALSKVSPITLILYRIRL